jgi:hypothetical protein
MVEYPRPFVYGDDWNSFLGEAVVRFWKWRDAELDALELGRELRPDEAVLRFPTRIEAERQARRQLGLAKCGHEPRVNALVELEMMHRGLPHFVNDAAGWCDQHQQTGEDAFTEDREKELAQRVNAILDRTGKLNEYCRLECDAYKGYWRDQIRRRFQDGRRGQGGNVQMGDGGLSLSISVETLTVASNGKVYDVASGQALRWLNVLAKHPGEWIAGRALKDYDGELDGVRTDKLKQHLPSEILALIESDPGKGSRLRMGAAMP